METQEYIKKDIESMKEQLNELMASYGSADYGEILELSQKIDELINQYFQCKQLK